MTRPTKWTPRRRELVLEAIRLGAPKNAACAHAGISTVRLTEWLARGKAEAEAGQKSEYAKFYQDFLEATPASVLKALRVLDKALEKNSASAAMWLLERTVPEFRKSSNLEITGSGGGPIVVTTVEVAPVIARKPELIVEGKVLSVLTDGE